MTSRCWIVPLAMVLACSGCTTASLERYTLKQIESSGEYRAKETLDCLATVAADPDNLPSFALLADGITRIQDSAGVSGTIESAREVIPFSSAILAPMGSRSPQGQWTVDPIVEFEKLQAIRCACAWVIYGPDAVCQQCAGILNSPADDPTEGPRAGILNSADDDVTEGPHFGVAHRLAALPQGWLHVGRLKDVPVRACHRAHCGSTWVWVMPEDMQGLNDFILVLHDIATLDTDGYHSRPLLVTLTREEPTQLRDPTDPEKKTAVIRSDEIRAIKPEHRAEIDKRIKDGIQNGKVVDISWAEWLAWTKPYHGTRTNLNPAVAVGNPTPRESIPSREIQVAPGLPTSPKPPGKNPGNPNEPGKDNSGNQKGGTGKKNPEQEMQ